MPKTLTKTVLKFRFEQSNELLSEASKIIKSVNDKKQNNQTQKFLEGLVSETYKVDDKFLYENLFYSYLKYFIL